MADSGMVAPIECNLERRLVDVVFQPAAELESQHRIRVVNSVAEQNCSKQAPPYHDRTMGQGNSTKIDRQING